MSLVGISGPLSTGKSTLVSLVRQELPMDSVIVSDIHDKVFQEVSNIGEFCNFKEIYKDRDYLLIYYTRLVKYYVNLINDWKNYEGLVLIDGTHIDLLIYGMLSLWYHKPIKGILEGIIQSLLSVKNELSVIYMTLPDDENHKVDTSDIRRSSVGFRKNRGTELQYYEIFRDLPYIVTLPSTSVLDCDRFVIDDLKSRNLI